MIKKIILLVVLVVFSFGVYAESDHGDFSEAKNIIDKKIPLEDLTEVQLEQLGEYYMEQLHPGDAHERMDAMMGGKGSESLRQMHINMGKNYYNAILSGEDIPQGGMVGTGMGGMMGARIGDEDSNIMHQGKCGMMDDDTDYMSSGKYTMMGRRGSMISSSMLGYGAIGAGVICLIYFAIGSLIFSLIFWFTYKLMIKKK